LQESVGGARALGGTSTIARRALPAEDGEFGRSVASAGDVNGDGYADLVVGAIGQDAGALQEGNAFVYLGGPTAVPSTPSTTLDNPANQANGYFGRRVASAGDVNADGYADLVVGAPGQNAGSLAEGNAFVYLGGPTGVPATPSTTLDNPANQVGGNFGFSVASAGDVNGDGATPARRTAGSARASRVRATRTCRRGPSASNHR
jgi:hypothetical protein